MCEVPFFISINYSLTYGLHALHFQYYSGRFTALVPFLSFPFHVADCTVPFSASSENLPVSYHSRLCFVIYRYIGNNLLFCLPSCLFPTFKVNPNYVIIVIINQRLKFIVTIVIITSLFIHVLTQQHNRQLQNNAHGEKDKKKTQATNK